MTSGKSYVNIQNIDANNELYLGEVARLQRIRGIFLLIMLLILFVPTGCGPFAAEQQLRVGIVPGPQAGIMQVVKQAAAKEGVQLELVDCSDYMEPNVLLEKGAIDANSYQPQPFLLAQQAERGYDFTVLRKTVLFPVGMYSRKIRDLADLPEQALVVIPQDAVSGSRARLLLAQAGLVKLSQTQAAVAENPKQLHLVEAEATAMRQLAGEADLLVMGTSCAVEAGFVPRRDALFLETADSPYANVIAIRSADKDSEALQKLSRAYRSAEVRDYIENDMGGIAIAAW